MMAHIEQFRIVRAALPDLADQLMVAWGGPEFSPMVGEKMRSMERASAEQLPLRQALEHLKTAHDDEFPSLAEVREAPNPEAVNNANFRIINERFPHLGAKMASYWGKPTFSVYVNGLMNDTRDGQRKGFPAELMIALWHILEEHDVLYPECRMRTTDIWSLNDPA